jgi:hypothetical protein
MKTGFAEGAAGGRDLALCTRQIVVRMKRIRQRSAARSPEWRHVDLAVIAAAAGGGYIDSGDDR